MDDLVAWLRGVLDEDGRLADPLDPDDAEKLADIEAKRAILDLHGPIWRDIGYLETDEYGTYDTEQELEVCDHCVPRHSSFPTRADVPGYPCQTVRLLASAYRHRPGYRDEWRP